jgi:Kef-type K+ transport system membrane component KefB
MQHNFQDPLAILLAQIITILVARFWLDFQKIGQPSVIGEIIACNTYFIRPLYFPEFSGVLFPAASLGNLKFLSQIGLILLCLL